MTKYGQNKSAFLSHYIYIYILSAIFLLILAALLYMGAVSTCFIDRYEYCYHLPDDPVRHIITACVFLGGLTFVWHRWGEKIRDIAGRLEADHALFLRWRNRMLLVIWFALSLWVVCTQVPAVADQRVCLQAAQKIAEGDFDPTGPVSHAYIYNNLTGWIVLLYICNKLFGQFNIVAYQLLNAGLITWIIKLLADMGESFRVGRLGQLAIILCSACFFPLLLYVSFIYGTIPGLCFALLAIKLEMRFVRGESLQWKDAVLSALCISLAVMLKMNYLIFLIAMIIDAALVFLRRKSRKLLLFFCLILVFYNAQARLPVMVYEHLSQEPFPKGCSFWAWAVMGLQEGERPGWYNGYARMTLEASGYDAARQEVWLKDDIKTRLRMLWQDKEAARYFFVEKTASQWNEPSLQSIWISDNCNQGLYHQTAVGINNDWPYHILSPAGNDHLTRSMNVLSFLLLLGNLLYLLVGRKTDPNGDTLILAMIFVGGFLFHLVWEAKGQYAFPYYVLLIPYTVMGFSCAASKLSNVLTALCAGQAALIFSRRKFLTVAGTALLVLLFLWYLFHGTYDLLTRDEAAYRTYLESAVSIRR